ncbi:MAG: hypothetical protein HYW48_06575 [Deltaproteobacteria bacterium]|nr:hypothetical protein [Deltaproteobacteria bacterium]
MVQFRKTKIFAKLSDTLPDGSVERNEYVARNPKRNDRNLGSFRINLNTGKWADFAIEHRGGDLISLYAYLNGLSQIEAAVALDNLLDEGY